MLPPAKGPRLSILILLSALGILPINIFLPSLPNMAADFGVDYGVAGLTLVTYAAVSAFLQIIMGPFSDRYGRRPVVLCSLALFVIATIGCALATDFRTFLLCRALQAVIAPTYAVSLAVIRDTSDEYETASTIGYVAMAWAVAPMLGPSIGGLLDHALEWRASFWFLAGLGAFVFALVWYDLAETNKFRSNSIAGQFRDYPHLLRSRLYWAYALCMTFSIGAFYAFLAGAPLVAQSVFNLTPLVSGAYLGSITGGFIFGSFLAGRYSHRFKQTTTLVAGRVLACAGLLAGLVLLGAGIDHVMAFFAPCLFVGISNGLTMPSAHAGAMSVRPTLAGSAAGLASAITIACAAFISWVASVLVTEQNARYAVLGVMLASAMFALAAALSARKAADERMDSQA